MAACRGWHMVAIIDAGSAVERSTPQVRSVGYKPTSAAMFLICCLFELVGGWVSGWVGNGVGERVGRLVGVGWLLRSS